MSEKELSQKPCAIFQRKRREGFRESGKVTFEIIISKCFAARLRRCMKIFTHDDEQLSGELLEEIESSVEKLQAKNDTDEKIV